MSKTKKSSKQRSVDALTLRHFYTVSSRFGRLHYLALLTPLSAIGLGVMVPFYIGKILASLTQPGSDITPLFMGLVIVSLVTVIANRIAYSSYLSLLPKVMAALQAETLTALLSRSAGFHNNRVSGKLVSDAMDYTSAYMQLASLLYVHMTPFAVIMLVGIIIVTVSSPLLGLVLLAMVSLAIGTALWFRHVMTPHRLHRHVSGKAVTAHLADTIVNNQTVKTFGAENFELKKHTKLSTVLLTARLHDWGAVAKDGMYRVIGLLIFQIIFISVVTYQVRQDPALLATGIFAFAFTVTLSNRLFQIADMIRQLEEALLSATPMTEMLQESAEIVDAPDAANLKVTAGNVVLDGVTFAYQDNPDNDPVFRSLDIHIKGGEKVGLVGPSGGGKSTFAKLILRFEDLTSGHILIDGQDISSVTQHSLRGSIGYVSQEPLLFHRTISENIAYGKLSASVSDIEEAARRAHADDFIRKLPQGYDTIVGERGVKLSGGQRQRIAIARAILKDAPILLLDEATSALDSASEKAIQKALSKLMERKTAIVIAHRLSTIQQLDRIIVLDDGRIVEEGTHHELINNDGLYAKLWSHQSGGFIDET